MTLATFGVMMFLVGILLMLVLPTNMMNIKVIVAWIAVVFLCIGGWILMVLFLIVALVFGILTNL